MITAEYFRSKFVKPVIERHKEEGREEGKIEGAAEGRSKMHRKWAGWNNRRLEAEEAGLPFDEPPPDDDGDR